LPAVDLFCGAGGLSLGFEMTGAFEVVAAFDHFPTAIYTYNANREDKVAALLDLTKNREPVLKLGRPYLVLGGPPCQDFSQANRGRDVSGGTRGNLTPLFADLACRLRPKWIVMENVNTIKSIGDMQLAEAVRTFKEYDYGFTELNLNAVDFGVPQMRKRLFLIARQGGIDREMESYVIDQKGPPATVKDLKHAIFEEGKAPEYYYRHPVSYSRRAIFSINEPSATIRGVNRPVPKTYNLHKNDATKDLRRVRPLTYKERAAIQTFPRSYKWLGSKTEIELQIGNAVPPILARSVARAILKFNADHREEIPLVV
jgi:DNA (cytosine-5)-methyltransferase 1